MMDKLLETVPVQVYLQRLRCPNQECDGVLEFDGKQRTQNGIHGGTLEFRHHCTGCPSGVWVEDKYPKVQYEIIEEEEDDTTDLSDDTEA